MKNTYRNQTTTSYSVAHYILIFLLICLGVVVVGWLLIAAGYRNYEQQLADDDPVVEETVETTTTTTATTLSPCAQKVMNEVAQMWAYSQNDVPQKYWDMAVEYLNSPVSSWTEGTCNDIRYICNPGQIRRECDPCAVSNAMSRAMEAHTRDLKAKNCPNDK